MDIQKEREAFEKTLKDQFKGLVDLSMCKNSDGTYMNWDAQVAWCAWQAAKAQAVPKPVLDAPARVGNGNFGIGVKWSTVIGAAQRQFIYHTENNAWSMDNIKQIREGLRK